MEQKQKYAALELEVLRFHVDDIMTACGLIDGDEGSGDEFDMGEIFP